MVLPIHVLFWFFRFYIKYANRMFCSVSAAKTTFCSGFIFFARTFCSNLSLLLHFCLQKNRSVYVNFFLYIYFSTFFLYRKQYVCFYCSVVLDYTSTALDLFSLIFFAYIS